MSWHSRGWEKILAVYDAVDQSLLKLLTRDDIAAIATQESSGRPAVIGRDRATGESKIGVLQLRLDDARPQLPAEQFSLADGALAELLKQPAANLALGVKHLEAIAHDLRSSGVKAGSLLPYVAVAHYLGIRPATGPSVYRRLAQALLGPGAVDLPDWGALKGANGDGAWARHAQKVLWNWEFGTGRRRADLSASSRERAYREVGGGAANRSGAGQGGELATAGGDNTVVYLAGAGLGILLLLAAVSGKRKRKAA